MRLVARRLFRSDELVIDEQPIVYCDLLPLDGLDAAFKLTLRLLDDPHRLATYQQLRLATNPEFDLFASDDTIKQLQRRSGRTRDLARRVYMSVLTNCIICLAPDGGPVGYGVYPVMSRADHSCEPNCRVVPSAAGRRNSALLAERDIKAGEPITWSYRQERVAFLASCVDERNLDLVDVLRFACRCPRCERERDPILQSVDLIKHYHDRLMARVRAAVLRRAGSVSSPVK
jgi:hypothetical protein